MKKNNDKFYTKPEIADDLIKFLLSKVDIDKNDIIIEPSAGNGSFSNNSNLINYRVEAYDILPENKNVKKMNWFDYKPMKEDYVVIGNPPFGERSLLAIDFFNKASFANLIAFVLPVSFCKYSTQKMLDENFKLAFEIKLPQESFLDNGKDYSVRTVFQIWIKKNSKYDIFEKDYRKNTPPDKNHKDFKIWQYNATKQSENVIEEDWEYAVYRQGYHDYGKIFTKKDKEYIKNCMIGCKETNYKKQQFFFIKPLNEYAETIIKKMDFNELAERNTATPGFGKADFVEHYKELAGEI